MHKPSASSRTLLVLSLALAATLLVPSPVVGSIVYEKEDNNNCDQADTSGNDLSYGDTNAGTTTYSTDQYDYWSLGHPGNGKTLRAHYGASNAAGTDIWIVNEDCNSIHQWTNVGLSEEIEYTFTSNDHYYIVIDLDSSALVEYQFDDPRLEDPPECGEDADNFVEHYLECGELQLPLTPS